MYRNHWAKKIIKLYINFVSVCTSTSLSLWTPVRLSNVSGVTKLLPHFVWSISYTNSVGAATTVARYVTKCSEELDRTNCYSDPNSSSFYNPYFAVRRRVTVAITCAVGRLQMLFILRTRELTYQLERILPWEYSDTGLSVKFRNIRILDYRWN